MYKKVGKRVEGERQNWLGLFPLSLNQKRERKKGGVKKEILTSVADIFLFFLREFFGFND